MTFTLSNPDEFIKSSYQELVNTNSPAFSERMREATGSFHKAGFNWSIEALSGYFSEGLLSHYLYKLTGLTVLSGKSWEKFPHRTDELNGLLTLFDESTQSEVIIPLLNDLAGKIRENGLLIGLGGEFMYLRAAEEKLNKLLKQSLIDEEFGTRLLEKISKRGFETQILIYDLVRYFQHELIKFICKYKGNFSQIRDHLSEFNPNQNFDVFNEKINELYKSRPVIDLSQIAMGTLVVQWAKKLDYSPFFFSGCDATKVITDREIAIFKEMETNLDDKLPAYMKPEDRPVDEDFINSLEQLKFDFE